MIVVLSVALIAVAYHLGEQFEGLVLTGHIVGDEGAVGATPLTFPRGTAGCRRGRSSLQHSTEMVERGGLRPGDVGYDGYDLGLFEGVFEDAPSPATTAAAAAAAAAGAAGGGVATADNDDLTTTAAVVAAAEDGASTAWGKDETADTVGRKMKPHSRFL
jgi:hypothetical protein